MTNESRRTWIGPLVAMVGVATAAWCVLGFAWIRISSAQGSSLRTVNWSTTRDVIVSIQDAPAGGGPSLNTLTYQYCRWGWVVLLIAVALCAGAAALLRLGTSVKERPIVPLAAGGAAAVAFVWHTVVVLDLRRFFDAGNATLSPVENRAHLAFGAYMGSVGYLVCAAASFIAWRQVDR